MNRRRFFLAGLLPFFGRSQTVTSKPGLTAKELIEVIADYEIHHMDAPPQLPWYGLTDFDARKMWLVGDVDLAQRRKVAIHECLHVALKMRGDEAYSDEDAIGVMVDAEYKRLFG